MLRKASASSRQIVGPRSPRLSSSNANVIIIFIAQSRIQSTPISTSLASLSHLCVYLLICSVPSATLVQSTVQLDGYNAMRCDVMGLLDWIRYHTIQGSQHYVAWISLWESQQCSGDQQHQLQHISLLLDDGIAAAFISIQHSYGNVSILNGQGEPLFHCTLNSCSE